MGGVVQSLMYYRHVHSIVPHEVIQSYRSHDGPYNVAVPDAIPEAGNCSVGYRNYKTKNLSREELRERYYNSNLVDLLSETCTKHADKTAMGYREIDHYEKTTITDESSGKQKPWEYIHLKPRQTISFNELWQRILCFGRGLRALGVAQPSDFVGIYEDTRPEWIMACFGLWTQAMTGVTVYSNLGEDALVYAIKESEVNTIVTNGKFVRKLQKIAGHTSLKHVVYLDALPPPHHDNDTSDSSSFELIAFEEVMEAGKKEAGKVSSTDASISSNSSSTAPSDRLPIKPDDLALIMYTSGTTGDPKGVMMTHGNVAASLLICRPRLEYILTHATEMDDFTYLAYLPLAHILEFAVELVVLLRGAFVGYGNPRTLTSTSARPHGDLEEYRPQVLIGVPRVFETIRKSIEAKITPGLKRRIFDGAYEERARCLKEGQDTPFYNQRVFSTVRNALGGRIATILYGGAPLSGKTQEWLSVTTGASIVSGYGLTETCAILATQLPGDTDVEVMGVLMEALDMRLRDTDEEWKHTDKPESRGEVVVRGPAVTQGYYKQPDRTAEAWDANKEWFATGDLGAIDPTTGVFRLVGRVKALAKNVFGEYIALDALESTYVLNDLCAPNGVCLLVNAQRPYVTALVVTDEPKATKFARANDITGTYPDMLKDPAFNKAAAASLAATAKEHGKKPFEAVKYVRVLSDEWTPDNGILTAASKIKRREIDNKYADVIADLFKEE